LFAAISYWGIGFTTAHALAFHTALGAVGVWIGLAIGTAVYAVLLILRFRRLARHLELVTIVTAH
jgi:multidrug resistance protein, MATE family